MNKIVGILNYTMGIIIFVKCAFNVRAREI
jgi:hypothetical protein